MRMLRVRWLTFTLLFSLGCSPSDRAEVSGSVQLDGQPVEEGSIQFIPVEGTKGPSAGAVITKGSYHIARGQGVVVGKNRVELRAFKTTGRKVQDPTAPQGVKTEERVQAFPPEYSDRSTEVRDIQPGSNTIDFDVVTSGKRKVN